MRHAAVLILLSIRSAAFFYDYSLHSTELRISQRLCFCTLSLLRLVRLITCIAGFLIALGYLFSAIGRS